MNILFVCKANRFRSKCAEAIFNKLNKNKKIKAKSAGIRLDNLRPYVAQSVQNALARRGYEVADETSQEVNGKLISWADKIVIAADNVSLDIFPKEKREVWKIEDADESESGKIEIVIGKLELRVKNLVKTLKV